MSFRRYLFIIPILLLNLYAYANKAPKNAVISNAKIKLTLNVDRQASISALIINGQKVISGSNNGFTSVKIDNATYSSLHLKANPVLVKTGDQYIISGITYGDKSHPITENWVFTVTNKN